MQYIKVFAPTCLPICQCHCSSPFAFVTSYRLTFLHSQMPGAVCDVAVCKNGYIKTKHLPSDQRIIYHRLKLHSADAVRFQKWVQLCSQTKKSKKDPYICVICSVHFKPEDYERDLKAELLNLPPKRVLKRTSLPSLFLQASDNAPDSTVANTLQTAPDPSDIPWEPVDHKNFLFAEDIKDGTNQPQMHTMEEPTSQIKLEELQDDSYPGQHSYGLDLEHCQEFRVKVEPESTPQNIEDIHFVDCSVEQEWVGASNAEFITETGTLQHRKPARPPKISGRKPNGLANKSGRKRGRPPKEPGGKRGRPANESRCMSGHVAKEAGRTQHRCTHCDESFDFASTLRSHMAAHRSENKFQCAQCSKKYTSKSALVYHIKSHLGRKDFLCEVCGMAFAYKKNRDRHIVTHSKQKKHKCIKCKKWFHSDYYYCSHVMACHPEVKLHQCAKCSKSFANLRSLQKHQFHHSAARNLTCKFCSKKFAFPKCLARHQLLHSKDFECKLCFKKFSSLQSLKRHQFRLVCMHCDVCFKTIGELKYHCDICYEAVLHKSKIKKHVCTHERGGRYKCHECGEAFNFLKNLSGHDLVVHESVELKQFECAHCELKYVSRGDLKYHLLTHTVSYQRTHATEKSHDCEICGEGFASASNMSQHILTHANLEGSEDAVISVESKKVVSDFTSESFDCKSRPRIKGEIKCEQTISSDETKLSCEFVLGL